MATVGVKRLSDYLQLGQKDSYRYTSVYIAVCVGTSHDIAVAAGPDEMCTGAADSVQKLLPS